MKALPFVIVIGLVILQTHNLLVMGQAKEKSCRSVVQDLTKMQLTLISQCSKKMKFKNGKEKSKKQNCILRCVLIEIGILNKEGQAPPMEEIQAFLNKFFPESLMEQANKTFNPCMDLGLKAEFGTVEADPFCSSYDPFIKCLMSSLPTLCPN